MQEVWKDIEGYEGLYQVSNLGRVKSLDRYIPHNRYGVQFRKGKLLVPTKRKKTEKYLAVCLTKNKRTKTHAVHTLVAVAFLGYSEGMEVNHKDENPTNNCVDNLEWTTHRKNMNHNGLLQRIEQPKKKKINAYDKQGNLCFSFNSICEAGRNGFNRAAISNSINGKARTSGGYIWAVAE